MSCSLLSSSIDSRFASIEVCSDGLDVCDAACKQTAHHSKYQLRTVALAVSDLGDLRTHKTLLLRGVPG